MQPLWFNEIGARHSHAVGHAANSDHISNSHIRVRVESKDDNDLKRSQFIDEVLEKLRKRNAPIEPLTHEQSLKEAA